MCPSGVRDPRRESAGESDFRPAFDVLDADRDGKISREDLKTFFDSVFLGGGAAADEDISSMITVADADRDGFVEFDEFEHVLTTGSSRRAVGGGGVMDEVFKVMDRDGDGKVGFDDLKGYMLWAGMPVSDEEIRAMIRMGGGDEEDGVCYEGFVRILAVDDFARKA